MDSSTPQIRSRITVVCAECKRLKLKCDRRNPCGSCTKRDTVMRCIYSPAAAEKVDLHSLNNRLIQVEGLLALMTAGKNPPPFQSSYPLAQIPLMTHHKSGRPHIPPGTASSMISISMHDISSIWLSHCNLDVDFNSKKDPVKLEPSLLDSIVSPSSPNLPPLTIYYPQNYYPSSFSDLSYILPPHSSSSPASSPTSIQNDSTTTSSPPSTSLPPKPHPTPSLLALLPLPSTRTRLLHRARTAYPELGVLIPWGRVLDLSADPEELHEREKEKVKEKKTQLANALFYGIRVDEDRSQTFPLFVVLCYLLSLGAKNVTEGVDKSFLYALAGQAMGVWETYRSTHEQDQDQEAPDHNGFGLEEDDAVVGNEEVDHVLACLMQVICLVRGVGAKNDSMKVAFPLMGKLVNLARAAGLARDPDGVDAKKGSKDATKERKRMLWWEIMFYDTFVSDVLNQPANVTLTSYSTRRPACASPFSPSSSATTSSSSHASSSSRKTTPSQHRLSQHQSQAHIDDGEIDLDANIDEEDEHRNPGKTGSKTRGTKGRAKAALLIKPRDAEIGSGENNLPEVVFGVRCRLTQLIQTIKHHLSRPYPSDSEPTTDLSSPSSPLSPSSPPCQCEYGYTLDQAVRLEGEVRTWVAELPPYLRLDRSFASSSSSSSFFLDAGAGVGAGDDVDSEIFQFGAGSSMLDPNNRASSSTSLPRSSPSRSSSSSQSTPRLPSTAILAAELAILANRLIMAVYIPFLRPSLSSSQTGDGGAGTVHPAYVAHSWSPASRATVDAARGVVRAGMVMYRLLVGVGATSAGRDASESVQGMILGEFYSLEKALVDAAVVCTHAGVVNGGVKVQKGKGVLEDAGAGLEVLAAMGMGRRVGEMMRVVDALRRKVEGLGVSLGVAERGEDNILKRKREVDREVLDKMEVMPPSSDGMFYEYETSSSYGSRPMENHRSPLGGDVELGQGLGLGQEVEPRKEKKHAKKGHVHPAVGYRVREGKAAPPWAQKHRRGSGSSSPAPPAPPPLPPPPQNQNQTMGYQKTLGTPPQLPPQIVQEQAYRSRSSSLSVHAMDFSSVTFGGPQQQPQQPQPQPQHQQTPTQVFSISTPGYNAHTHNPTHTHTHTHNHGTSSQQLSHAGSHHAFEFEPSPLGSSNPGDSSAYGDRSPYATSTTSGSISNVSSPYTASVNGVGNGRVNGTPATFSQSQPQNQNVLVGTTPQTFYHVPQGYDGGNSQSYEGQQQQQQGMMPMEMESMVDSSPPPLGVQQQQQQMQRHLQYQDVRQVPVPQAAAAPPPTHTWNAASRQHHPLPPHHQGIDQSGGPYWGPSGAQVFY